MRLLTFFISLILLSVVTPALAQSETNGKVVFDKWCSPCHGAVGVPERGGVLPGTSALTIKYRGAIPALLEERTDLSPEFIRTVVRSGYFGMPITRKTEVSDAQLNDIIAYLTRNN